MQKNINKYIPLFERLLSLLIVFLLLAGTVVWSGKIFGRQIGTSSATDSTTTTVALPNAEELQKLGLQEVHLEALDSAAWEVTGKDGAALGTIVSTAPYAKDVTGFAGPTPLYLFLSPDNIVKAVVAADNAESPDFCRQACNGIFSQIVGLSANEAQGKRVDAVTGATFSSNAIIANVKQTLSERAKANRKAKVKPVIGWGKTVAVAAVLLLGILASWRLRGIKSVRLAILILNVCVTGFWCGQFLSVSMLRGWIQNGLDPILYLPAVLMLLVAIAMPFFKRPHHHCLWVCPFGSLQELAYYLPLPKVRVSAPVFKLMRLTRTLVLALLLLLLWMGIGASVLDYEPFTAFMLSTATPGVLVLATLFVIASIFIPHPWCRCLCPMGTLLELSEDSGVKQKKKNIGA